MAQRRVKSDPSLRLTDFSLPLLSFPCPVMPRSRERVRSMTVTHGGSVSLEVLGSRWTCLGHFFHFRLRTFDACLATNNLVQGSLSGEKSWSLITSQDCRRMRMLLRSAEKLCRQFS